jgi:hypothetical protein
LIPVRFFLIFFFFLMLSVFIIRVDGCGAASPDCGKITMESLRTDPARRHELAGYAGKIFLAKLSFAAPVQAPVWAEDLRRGCFVTFFSGGRVIACAGSFLPRTSNLATEVAANVAQALHLDPRARSITRRKAIAAHVRITFPGEPVPVVSPDRVDPARQGLFVENDRFGVAIVPGEAKTASWAFREAMRRLGETDAAKVRIFAFDAWAVTSDVQ